MTYSDFKKALAFAFVEDNGAESLRTKLTITNLSQKSTEPHKVNTVTHQMINLALHAKLQLLKCLFILSGTKQIAKPVAKTDYVLKAPRIIIHKLV